MENTIIARIFNTMKEKGITQKQLADKLGISQGTVAGWKQRDCPPPINYVSDIADMLEISINYLITGNDNPIKYSLNDTEQLLIRLFRTTSKKNQDAILNLALSLADEHYINDINPKELLKTLNG